MAELLDAARSDSRLTALVALRDDLAADLDACESLRDKASLSLRYMDVLAQIDDIRAAAPEQKGTVLDELAKRRAEQKPAARKTRATRTK